MPPEPGHYYRLVPTADGVAVRPTRRLRLVAAWQAFVTAALLGAGGVVFLKSGQIIGAALLVAAVGLPIYAVRERGAPPVVGPGGRVRQGETDLSDGGVVRRVWTVNRRPTGGDRDSTHVSFVGLTIALPPGPAYSVLGPPREEFRVVELTGAHYADLARPDAADELAARIAELLGLPAAGDPPDGPPDRPNTPLVTPGDAP